MQQNRRRLLCSIALLFAVNITIIALAQQAQAATWRQGSSGETVRTIQTKLKNWGYYDGTVDGIFGSATTRAVKYFQRQNGLAVDGIVGPATLAALGMQNSGGASAQSNEVALLARVISAEARGEPYSGQVAVGAVILNRVEHPSFPNTIAGVVYQPGAFTCMVDGQIDQPVAESSIRAAREALAGSDPSGGAIYYFNPSTATSAWIWSRPLIKTIGKHRFCS
jgi:N-acetylmuramoyl-L-alanine amidase